MTSPMLLSGGWLYQTLAGDSVLVADLGTTPGWPGPNVFAHDNVPQTATFPRIVLLPVSDVPGFAGGPQQGGGTIYGFNQLWWIRFDDSSADEAVRDRVIGRIYTLLQESSDVQVAGAALECTYEQGRPGFNDADGLAVSSWIEMYRVWVYPTA